MPALAAVLARIASGGGWRGRFDGDARTTLGGEVSRRIQLGQAGFTLSLDECFAEFLAGLEARIALGGYRDGLASPRITSLPLLLLLHDEATKSAQINALVCVERFGNGSKNGLKYGFDLRLFATGFRRHCFDQLCFRHLFQCTGKSAGMSSGCYARSALRPPRIPIRAPAVAAMGAGGGRRDGARYATNQGTRK
jgi:hypothetical protein